MKNTTLPAIDDMDFRKKQQERFVEGIGQLGDYCQTLKKSQKWNIILSIFMVAILLGLVGTGLIYGIYKGGLDGVMDRMTITRHFNCSSGSIHDEVRNYDDAESFINLYGGSCEVLHYNKNGEKQ